MTETGYGTGLVKLVVETDGKMQIVGEFDDVGKARTHIKAQARKGEGKGTTYHIIALKATLVIG